MIRHGFGGDLLLRGWRGGINRQKFGNRMNTRKSMHNVYQLNATSLHNYFNAFTEELESNITKRKKKQMIIDAFLMCS